MSKYHWILAIALLCASVLAVYLPGVNGSFQFDDMHNIVKNDRVHMTQLTTEEFLKAIFSGSSGVLKRPISMLSFAVNHYFVGLDPFWYKLTNIFIHIVNAILLLLLTILLLGHSGIMAHSSKRFLFYISLFIVLAWSIHPINLTSVLYVVQRMASLATLFIILGLLFYIAAKSVDNNKIKSSFYLVLVIIFGLLAVFSKENGALLFVFIPLVEIFIYKMSLTKARSKNIFYLFFTVTLFIPSIAIMVYSMIQPSWILKGYSNREYNLIERLLTQSRVVWLYIGWIFYPSTQALGLYHDDIIISSTLFNPITTLYSLFGHSFLLTILFFLWRVNKFPVFVFGISLFYVSQLIESTVLSLEIAHEHRNYFGSYGLIFSFSSLIFYVKNYVEEKWNHFILLFCAIILSVLSGITFGRASNWANHGLGSALIEVTNHPKSARAHYAVAAKYAELSGPTNKKFYQYAYRHFMESSRLKPNQADSLLAILIFFGQLTPKVDSNFVEDIKSRLKSGPIYANSVNLLSGLVTCVVKKHCNVEKEYMVGILKSAIDNPNLIKAGILRSGIFTAAAYYLSDVGNNYPKALELSELAIESAPYIIQYKYNIINLAIAFKDHATASHWVNRIKNNDFLVYRNEIESFETKIRRLKDKITSEKNSDK